MSKSGYNPLSKDEPGDISERLIPAGSGSESARAVQTTWEKIEEDARQVVAKLMKESTEDEESYWAKEANSLRALKANQAVLALLWQFIKANTKLIVEVVIIGLGFYYLDLFLDLNMLNFFWQNGDIKFFCVSVTGIVVSIGLSFFDMAQKAENTSGDHSFMLRLGFLLPFQLHVLFLGIYSVLNGKKHAFLYTSKLFQSVVESSTSAAVQTYALIFWDLSWSVKMFAFPAIIINYVSIAFAYTTFDKADIGLSGFPGQQPKWFKGVVPSRLLLVFMARICEVASRFLTIGFFQLAVRNHWHFGTCGILYIFCLDGIVLLGLLSFYQGYKRGQWANVSYLLPNLICLFDPLLEHWTVVSMPAIPYYILRITELAVMFKIAHMVHGWHRLNELFMDDQHFLYGAVLSTVGWMVLIPAIKIFGSHNGMLWWRPGMFAQMEFDTCFVAVYFRDKLLDLERVLPGGEASIPDLKEKGSTVDKVSQVVHFHVLCHAVIENAVQKLEEHLGVSSMTASKSAQTGKKAKAVLSENKHLITPESRALDMQPSATGSSASLDDKLPPKTFKDRLTDLHWKFFGHLLKDGSSLHNWYNETLKKAQRGVKDAQSQRFIFLTLVLTCANLAPYLTQLFDAKHSWGRKKRSNQCILTSKRQMEQKALYLQVLKLLCLCLDNEQMQHLLTMVSTHEEKNILAQLLRLVPPVPTQIAKEQTDLRNFRLQTQLQIFTEKCRLVKQVCQTGWRLNGFNFEDMAIQFLQAFNAQTKEAIEELVSKNKDCMDFMQKEQMHAMLQVWAATPKTLRVKIFRGPKPIVMKDSPRGGAVQPEEVEDEPASPGEVPCERARFWKELRAIFDGAAVHLSLRDKKRRMVMMSPAEREAIVASLQDNLRLKVFQAPAKHIEALRTLGLRATQIEEELYLEEIGEKPITSKHQAKDILERNVNVPISMQFKRLVELDPAVLTLDGLKPDKGWEIMQTEVLELCQKIDERQLRKCSPELADEFNGICQQLANECVEQLEKCFALIQQWANHYVDPGCVDLKLLQDMVNRGGDHKALIALAGDTKTRNQSSFDQLQDMSLSFQNFLQEVQKQYQFSNKVEKCCKSLVSKIIGFEKKEHKAVREYWHKLDTGLTNAASAQVDQMMEQRKLAREEAAKALAEQKVREESAKTAERHKQAAEEAANLAKLNREELQKQTAALMEAKMKMEEEKAGLEQEMEKLKEEKNLLTERVTESAVENARVNEEKSVAEEKLMELKELDKDMFAKLDAIMEKKAAPKKSATSGNF